MNLILDIGNTAAKGYVFNGNDIVEMVTVENLEQIKDCGLFEKYNFKGAIISSTRGKIVVPEFLSKIEKVVVMDANTKLPIESDYVSLTIGSDRLAAAVEACAMINGGEAIIFDCGTALTVDFVENNRFKGGFISPGIAMRFAALNTFTASLPLCELDLNSNEDTLVVATTTNEAIISGVVNSMMLEIEGYINKNLSKTIIFTGGYAFYFVKRLKIPIFANYELVPRGLNRILGYNEECM